MKACSLFVPVWLAPALAAPVFYTSTTLLVAGSTSHRPVFRPSHLVENEHEQSSSQRPVLFGGGRPHTIEDIPSTPSLDSERPLSTEQLMALGSPRTHQSSSPETFASPPSSAALLSSLPVSEKAPKGKPRVVTVGTLVVLEADRPFLLPGYYIPARPRGDVLIMGGIVALLLLALAMESLKTSFLARRLRRLSTVDDRKLVDEEASDEDDMAAAPFGGNYKYHFVEEKALQLPEKWDEKKGAI